MNNLLKDLIEDAAHQVVAGLLKDVKTTIKRKQALRKKKSKLKKK